MANKCKPGFKKRKGKCIKVSGSFKKSRKRGFNPFKMWGSYVGGIIGGILILSFGFFGEPISRINSLSVFLFSIGAVAGFLIGWGIHSLFRFIKQRKK